MSPITIFGTEWCEDTQHTRQHLEALGIPYTYIDIETDSGAATWVKSQNAGKQITPVVKMPGIVLSEPSNGELDTILRSRGLLA